MIEPLLNKTLRPWCNPILLAVIFPPLVSSFSDLDVVPTSLNRFSLLNIEAEDPVSKTMQCFVKSFSIFDAPIKKKLLKEYDVILQSHHI